MIVGRYYSRQQNAVESVFECNHNFFQNRLGTRFTEEIYQLTDFYCVLPEDLSPPEPVQYVRFLKGIFNYPCQRILYKDVPKEFYPADLLFALRKVAC